MRYIFYEKQLFIILLLLTVKIFSQPVDSIPKQNIKPNNSNAYKIMKYKKMQTTGIVLISLGSAALIGGVAL